MSHTSRPVAQVVTPEPVVEGAGVHLRRSLGTRSLDHLDPFLLLDHFASAKAADYEAGFPYHPHRGIETVTLVRHGQIAHGDSLGHRGTIGAGDIQWMSSGSGNLHEEMPQVRPEGIAGLQLWLNLPARDKMRAPWYRDIPSAEIPEFEREGVKVRVIAGASHGVDGAVQREHTEPLYLDLHLAPGATFEQPLPDTHNAFVYVYRGALKFDSGCAVPQQRMAILANQPGSDGVRLSAGEAPTRAILVAARPLNEPIAQYGPFVMNTQAELMQAVRDFQTGRLVG